jgi:hypothetical protein
MLEFKFSTPPFSSFQEPENPLQTELEIGINISESTLNKLKKLLPDILLKKDLKEIVWLSKANNLVFKLKNVGQFVFKTTNPLRCSVQSNMNINSRFQNMMTAMKICRVNNLNLLVIPHAKQFKLKASGKSHLFIVEEFIDLNPDIKMQQHYYHKNTECLDETIKQLAVFILKTGFFDVKYDNIPLINEKAGFQGYRRVALIDLEHINFIPYQVMDGLINLIWCVSESQENIVIEEAKKEGYSSAILQYRHLQTLD